jgi:hypothetical protein
MVKWENYHKTNSGWTHSSKHYYFLTEIIRVCDDKQNTTLMVIVCTSKQFKLLNFTMPEIRINKSCDLGCRWRIANSEGV